MDIRARSGSRLYLAETIIMVVEAVLALSSCLSPHPSSQRVCNKHLTKRKLLETAGGGVVTSGPRRANPRVPGNNRKAFCNMAIADTAGSKAVAVHGRRAMHLWSGLRVMFI
eukprot:scaffold78915_cov46-Phaeocystis_antarctica.AAC.1